MKPERIAELREVEKEWFMSRHVSYADKLRECLDALESAQSEIAQLSEARRVVPELDSKYANKYEEPTEVIAFREGFDLACELAEFIPATRVLKDGEVGVDREELTALQTIRANIRIIPGAMFSPTTRDIVGVLGFDPVIGALAKLDALRTAQAKGATP